MRPTPHKLLSLHAHEEQIRSESLKIIGSNEEMADYLETIQESLAHVFSLIDIESEPETEIHTLQLLAIRVLNCGASALKLGLAGYYQNSFSQMRDLLENVNLVDLFIIDKAEIHIWARADDKTLRDKYGPAAVRALLEKHPSHAGQTRKPQYASFSSYASHATYKGFRLFSPNNVPQAGCFLDEKMLAAMLAELARRIAHISVCLSSLIAEFESSVLISSKPFRQFITTYQAKYLSGDTSTSAG